MKNYITPKLLHSRFNKCGGYHRSAVTIEGDLIKLTSQETAFGIYIKAIEEIIFNYKDLKNKQDYYQGRIDGIQENLLQLAETYIDRKKMEVSFDINEFNEKWGNIKICNSKFSDIANLMPYVIHFAALKNGLNFENPNILTENIFLEPILNEKLVKCPKVKEKDLIQSIGIKIGIDPKTFLSDGRTLG